jgi:hypothetical protein
MLADALCKCAVLCEPAMLNTVLDQYAARLMP